MNKIVTFLLLFFITCSFGIAQTKQRKPNNRNKTFKDKPTIYDVDGKLISVEQAMDILASSNVKMEQIYEGKKPIGAKLVKNEMIGKLSADFAFKTIDDREINLTRQQQKITVLNFWYVGCEPCLTEIPVFNKIVEKYKDRKDIEFFAVTFIASEDVYGISNLISFLKKNKFDFQISIATKSALDAFQIKSYPQTIIIDRESKIIFWRSFLGKDAEPLNQLLEKESK